VGFMKKYDDLESLIKCNYPARAYFSALPDSVAKTVRQDGGKIRTATELMDISERFIHEFV